MRLQRGTVRLEDEQDAWEWAERHARHNWIFRGQRDADWPIRSTLERAARRARWSRPRADLEMGIVRRFQRHAHLYVSAPPDEDDAMEWLGILRHFGAPTRFVDWSYSYHVALFFAVRSADPTDESEDPVHAPGAPPPGPDERCAAVWAIDSDWLEARAYEHLERAGASDVVETHRADLHCREWGTFGAVYSREPAVPFVLKQNPWRLNERIVAQQGLFLCPGAVERSFEENLCALIRDEDHGKHVIRVLIPARLSLPLLQRAYRSGISLATLQPGLEGFVRSIGDLACAPEIPAPTGLSTPLGRPGLGTGRRCAPAPRVPVPDQDS